MDDGSVEHELWAVLDGYSIIAAFLDKEEALKWRREHGQYTFAEVRKITVRF